MNTKEIQMLISFIVVRGCHLVTAKLLNPKNIVGTFFFQKIEGGTRPSSSRAAES